MLLNPAFVYGIKWYVSRTVGCLGEGKNRTQKKTHLLSPLTQPDATHTGEEYEGVRLFARRTFTTPKIRTFTTPKFGHFPPPKKNICQEDNCHPQFFSSFFGALFLAFSTYSSWRTSRMGRRRCLTRWSWSTSSRGCVTRWSWSTSSRRCLTSWSWSTSSRGRRWKRSPRW